jgi:hypothetical protein
MWFPSPRPPPTRVRAFMYGGFLFAGLFFLLVATAPLELSNHRDGDGSPGDTRAAPQGATRRLHAEDLANRGNSGEQWSGEREMMLARAASSSSSSSSSFSSASSASSPASSNTPLGGVPPSNAEAVDVRFDVVIPDMAANLDTPLDPDEPLPKRIQTLIWCKSFLVEANEGEANNVIGVTPMPGLPNVHHMHLHVCDPDSAAWQKHRRMYADVDDSQPGAPGARGNLPLSCVSPAWERGSGCHGTAWTFVPGQSTMMFPPGVGMKIGSGRHDLRHLVLEVHYDMAHELKDVPDNSGIRLWAVKEAVVQHRMGVLTVADPFAKFPQALPPGEPSVEVNVFCPPGCTKKFPSPINVFASMVGRCRLTLSDSL